MSNKHRYILFGTGFLILACCALVIFPRNISRYSVGDDTTLVAEAREIEDPFKNIKIEARAAYVLDQSSGKVLYAKNEHAVLPLASITKIMTAITAIDLAPYSTVVTIDPEALREQGDNGLFGNERWSLKELLRFSLLVSSNDGVAAIASSLGSQDSTVPQSLRRAAFVEQMNIKAGILGLSDLIFNNESGLDVSNVKAGAYGSAEDVARLLEIVANKYPEMIELTRYKGAVVESIDGIKHYAQNTDEIAGKIPGLIAGKTGYSDLAGGNLAIVFDAGLGRPVIVVVLGSSYSGRFVDVEKLINASIQKIANQ